MGYKNPADYYAYHKAYNERRRKPRATTPRQAAIEKGDQYYVSEKPCVNGHTAKRRTKDRICTECEANRISKYRTDNPEAIKEHKRREYAKNKVTHLATKKVYRERNKGRILALATARKKMVKQRTPSWADKEMIRSYYDVCAFFNEVNGYIKYHVDHDIPLQGKRVSGLHVQNNLRILPAKDNISKKNKFEIDHAI